MCVSICFCVNISLILITSNSIVLSYKDVSLFYFYFTVGLKVKSRLYSILGVRPPWWQDRQSIKLTGVEGLKSAATTMSLGNRGWS